MFKSKKAQFFTTTINALAENIHNGCPYTVKLNNTNTNNTTVKVNVFLRGPCSLKN